MRALETWLDWTDQDLRDRVESAAVGGVVEFWAPWCPYSRLLKPKLEDLRHRYGERLSIGRVDVERFPSLVESWKVRYIPALVLFREGRAVRRLYGDRHAAEIEAYLRYHLFDR